MLPCTSTLTNVFVIEKDFFFYTSCDNICVWPIQEYIHRHARRQLTGQSKQRPHAFILVVSFRVFREGCRCKPVIISIILPWWLITAVVRVVASLRIIIFPISSLPRTLLFLSTICSKTKWIKKRIDRSSFCRIIFLLTFCSF